MRTPQSDVFVIRSEGRNLVRPATFILRGDSFRVRNFLRRKVTITVPWAETKTPVEIEPGDSKVLMVSSRVEPGAYAYTVEVAGGPRKERFPKGNSRPIVIIDP